MAALGGYAEVVKFLILEIHCDPMSRSNNNSAALHLSILSGNSGLLQFFIADLNCDPKDKLTVGYIPTKM